MDRLLDGFQDWTANWPRRTSLAGYADEQRTPLLESG